MRRPTCVRGLLWATLLSPALLSGRALGQPAAAAARPPQVWTIAVGIENYANGAIPDGRTAARNAERVQRWIRRTGWSPRHQLLLSDFGTNDPGEITSPSENILPTRRNLDWAFQRWLEANARADDVVVIYFAGESRTVSRPQGTAFDVRTYLLPTDANPLDIEQSGWSLERAVDQCVRRKLRVVCWLATAPSEAPAAAVPPAAAPATRPAAAAAPVAGGSPGIAWLSRLARWPGVTAWLASERPASATAGKSTDSGSVFTEALLAALGASGPGQPTRRPNLATCLRDLQEDPHLRVQGFCSLGGVPPSLTLWPQDLRKQEADPRPELVIQAGHADRITAMAFPADGKLIVTAAMDSTIRIWSTPDRSLLRVLPGQAVGVTAMAMTRDGRRVISGGGRGAVVVFDRLNDFKSIRPSGPQPHFKGVRQIALLPDDIHFVSIDADGQSALWEMGETSLSQRPWLNVRCQEVVCGGRVGPAGQDTGLVAARCEDGKVRVFNSAGEGQALRALTRPSPATMAVSTDGSLLAVGYNDGLVVVHDLKTGGHRDYPAAGTKAAVQRLVFSSAGLLAIGHKDGVRLVGPSADPAIVAPGEADARRAHDILNRPAQDLVFSPGGDYLAACIQEVGATRVWRIAGDGPPTEVVNDADSQATLLGFTGNGRGLAVADVYGGVEFRPLNPQGDEAPWAFPASRGKLQQLSASPDRQLILFLDEQRGVRIWDIKERTCRRLPGTYRAAAFIDDNRMVLVPDSNMGKHAGRLILADRTGKWAAAPFFASQAGGFNLPDNIPFQQIAVAPDGGQVAAASDKEPLVCVWETKNGLLRYWITTDRLEDPALTLAFSSDGRNLLTGGDSPAARLWALPARPGALSAPAVTFEDKSIKANITCVAIRPGNTRQVVIGHSNGQVHAWKWEAGQPQATLEVPRLVAGEFATAVKALCFTTDGRYLAASGDGKRIWLGAMDPRPRSIDFLAKLAPHHDEQINALCVWRSRPVLISGSDDTTIRFWDIEAKVLRGTFSAGSRPAVPGAAAVQELDWVLHTPEGFYDASAQATRLVHFRRPRPSRSTGPQARGRESGFLSVGVRAVEEAGQLDQLAAKQNVYGLGERLMRGEAPGQKPASEAAPPITISVAPPANAAASEALLKIKMAADNFDEVRLYHNDVPIPAGWDPNKKPAPGAEPPSLDVPVKLVSGVNRFYAMASRQDDYDSCSRVVEVNYEAPAERGQVHVLALGVKDYQTEARRLRYSEDDAEQLSEFIHRQGLDVAGRQGIRRVLLGKEVSRENVEKVFDEIAVRVEDRPQDTVVVFLAGHTDVFAPQRFCLLLPTFPFPKQAPVQANEEPVQANQAPILVAARGAPLAEENKKVDPRFVLPYSIIESNLSRLKALNRLVIVDACQAEAILVDPKVRAIRKWMELSSRKWRTQYLMGARRGELALEASSLAHGMLTYALLRGMQARLPKEPEEVKALALPADADYDGDGIISTDELDAYSKHVLPQLASIFPQLSLAGRGQNGGNAVAARDGGAGDLRKPAVNPPPDQALQVQGSEAGFPLVEVRKATGSP